MRLVEETEALFVQHSTRSLTFAPHPILALYASKLPQWIMTYHVVVRLLLLLDLLLLGRSLGSTASGGTGGSGRTSSGGGTTTTDVGEEVLDVLAVEGLGEERGPDGLDLDLGGRGEGGDLVTLMKLALHLCDPRSDPPSPRSSRLSAPFLHNQLPCAKLPSAQHLLSSADYRSRRQLFEKG